jgi:glutamate synthase (NADPH/NADH) small chain
MQDFMKQKRIEPNKRDVFDRLKDYKEIYEVFDKDGASTQSSRCVQCGDPYCHNACPLNNFIPNWLKSVSRDDLELAFNISNESSPFPEIMGRVCPQDRLCEGDCTLNDGFGAITIGSVETFISEEGFKKGYKPRFKDSKSDKSVAIIGSGPAGLSAATFLLREGINVSMYERADEAGGLLYYGIPGFKLDKEVVKRRVEWLVDAGMTLHLNTEVGRDIEFGEVADKHDAVFIGIGSTKSNELNISGVTATNNVMAIDFLKEVQKKNDGKAYDKMIDLEGKNVVVLGGGDTAMDCLRTSARLGAKSVKCLYRRDAASMPGSKKEYKNAVEEGVEFVFNVSPSEVIVNDQNSVIGLVTQDTKLVKKDDSDRLSLDIVKGSEKNVEADILIYALGFSAAQPDFLSENGIETNEWGEVLVGEDLQTSQLGIYAGGDCQRGADLVVTAALDGRTAAASIVESLIK